MMAHDWLVENYSKLDDRDLVGELLGSAFTLVGAPVLNVLEKHQRLWLLTEMLETVSDVRLVVRNPDTREVIGCLFARTSERAGFGNMSRRIALTAYSTARIAMSLDRSSLRFAGRSMRAILSGVRHWPRDGTQLVAIAVSTEVRGLGVGEALLASLLRRGRERRERRVWVLTHSDLAWSWYESLGFLRLREWRDDAYVRATGLTETWAYVYEYRLGRDQSTGATGARVDR